MIERLALLMTLASVSATTHAHQNLELTSTLHRLLHAIGSERLVVLGGTLLAVAVGLIVRCQVRKAGCRSGSEA